MGRPLLEDRDFLTVSETAEYFGLSRRKLFRLVKEPGLFFLAYYKDRKLVIKDEFKKYLAQLGVKEALKNDEPRTKKRLESQGTA